MADNSPDGYDIRVLRIEGQGSNWIVRVYKRRLFCHKLVSSDWFLDGAQAERFARQVRLDLAQKDNLKSLKERRPGWTLHRPDR